MKTRESIIRMFNVTKRFGGKTALEKVSLEVNTGEFVFITGPSGAGKSTLMKTLYLAETVSQGQIIVGGMNLARISRQKVPYLRRRFGVIFQDFKLINTRTVYDNVALVLEAAGEKPSRVKIRVMHALKHAGIDHKYNALPLSLSGGEQQRVAVARAVVGNPDIILADEPTGSLDYESARIIFNLLLDYNDRGTTVLVASHNIQLINATARGKIVALKGGILLKESVTALSEPVVPDQGR